MQVLGKKDNENITDPQMGNIKLDMEELEKIPIIFGEKDVIKALQLMPGVNTAGEGSSGFYVRGGSADQNLIWIDEAPVYNASHLLGFFSVFNSNSCHQSRTMTLPFEKYKEMIWDQLPDSLKTGDNDFEMPPFL